MSEANCRKKLELEGKPYPRTCPECGLSGPCKYFVVQPVVKNDVTGIFVVYEDSGSEGSSPPLGAFKTKEAAALFIYETDKIVYKPHAKIVELEVPFA